MKGGNRRKAADRHGERGGKVKTSERKRMKEVTEEKLQTDMEKGGSRRKKKKKKKKKKKRRR